MTCPKCGSGTLVVSTRGLKRRRKCTNDQCGYRFSTVSTVMSTQGRSVTVEDAINYPESVFRALVEIDEEANHG